MWREEVQGVDRRRRGAGRGVEGEEMCGGRGEVWGSTSRVAPFLAAVLAMALQAAGFISGKHLVMVQWASSGPAVHL